MEIHALDHPEELANSWGVAHIGAGDAHHQGHRGTGLRVGVFDSGIWPNHEDLTYDPVCSHGTSFGTLRDGLGHGTHVSGTIAALLNGTGVVGVAPEATLCIYKILSDDGGGRSSDVIRALEHVVDFNEANPDDPIRVLNHSYGGSALSLTFEEAFDRAHAAGVLHVAAAGNSGNAGGTGESCVFPAMFDSVIATAATDNTDSRADFSSTCAELELSAPGVDINSTWPGGYAVKEGTSMASPHLAGAAALAWAANPALKNEGIRAILHDTATPLGPSNHYGHGLVQAMAAVQAAVGQAPPALQSITVSPSQATIFKGKTQKFIAFGTYSDGSSGSVSEEATWTSSDEAIAAVDGNGLATGQEKGTATITATLDGMESSASLTVKALESITVSPSEAHVLEGRFVLFTATGTYSDGSTENVTTEATWTSSDEAVATVDSQGLAVSKSEGTVTITAALSGVQGTASLTVTGRTLESITVRPGEAHIFTERTVLFTARGTYADGSTRDVTAEVAWASSDAAVATVDSTGQARGESAGEATITAAMDGVQGAASLTVAPPPPPPSPELFVDINPGAPGSVPQDLIIVEGVMYFVADDGVHGRELWRSDGTEAGTFMFKDINPGAGGSEPAALTFIDFRQYPGFPEAIFFFTADDGVNGRELWWSDGTEAGTAMAEDINPGPGGSDPRGMTLDEIQAVVYFSADDGANGRELWAADFAQGDFSFKPPTVWLVKDINPGPAGSEPEVLTALDADPGFRPIVIYFSADDGVNGRELWRSDGTEEGTVMAGDINPGPGGSDPAGLTAEGANLYFSADDGANG